MRRLTACRYIAAPGLAVIFLSHVAAKADVIYTVAITGTIVNGTSGGIFGANGANLAGQAYTAFETFDATLSTYLSNGTKSNELSPVTANVAVTVANTTYSISVASAGDYIISSIKGGDSYDSITTYLPTHSGDAAFSASIYNFNYVPPPGRSGNVFLNNDSLSQVFSYTALPSLDNNSGGFYAPDGTSFTSKVTTISLNDVAAPVPEPG